MTRRLTHVDPGGRAAMVDVGPKPATHRVARAAADVRLNAAAFRAVKTNQIAKGNVLDTARIAGIAAAKQTAQLIPLCHPLSLTRIDVDLRLRAPGTVLIESRVEAHDRTGVEMEAMTAAAVAALTIYDMCKAVDKGITISHLRLLEKSGGRSGHYLRRGKA